MAANRFRLPANRRRQGGQSFLEYLAVTALAVVVLIQGNPSPLAQLANAIQKYYTDYSFAMSISSIPNCTITAGSAITVDACVDLHNPEWPVSVMWP